MDIDIKLTPEMIVQAMSGHEIPALYLTDSIKDAVDLRAAGCPVLPGYTLFATYVDAEGTKWCGYWCDEGGMRLVRCDTPEDS